MKKKINKIGAALTILTFGLICGIGGYELRSSTDSASSVLPITKGGTGNNYGNVPTADKLYTGRLINETVFDGTQNVNLAGGYYTFVNSNTLGDAYIQFNPFSKKTGFDNTNYTVYVNGCGSSSACFNGIFSAKDTSDALIQRKDLFLQSNRAVPPNNILTYAYYNNNLYLKVKDMANGRKVKCATDSAGGEFSLVTDSSLITTLNSLTFYYFDVKKPGASSAAPR
jgi:hypothetical protein